MYMYISKAMHGPSILGMPSKCFVTFEQFLTLVEMMIIVQVFAVKWFCVLDLLVSPHQSHSQPLHPSLQQILLAA
jgi:hypothetical protein